MTDYDDEGDCTVCGGEGFTDCWDGLECMSTMHLDDDCCECRACDGTGLASRQRIW